jgi:sugar transferase (PEP-CTERM/EpsH1 system associated)
MEKMTQIPASAGRVHVLHVVRHGLAAGGMENGIINVANALPADRFRVSVCALDSRQTFSERIRRSDAEYFLLPKVGGGIHWKLVWRLSRLLRRSGIDVVHSHNWGSFLYAVLAAKLAGVPVIHGEHGKNAGELDERNRPKRWTKSQLGRRVDRLVTVSRAIADEWAGYGVPEEKILWIPNGVDVERFRPRDDKRLHRRNFGLPEDGLLLGTVSRLDPIKNYEVLLAAFARLAQEFPGCHLAFLGDGPSEQTLRAQAHSLGLADRIYWLGRRPDPENFLPALDVFALPSKSEGMSNVVLEAMASGLPVVAADLPAHREVFEPDREGILVSPCTADALAQSLAGLMKNPEQRQALGRAARHKVLARFNLTRMISDYERLYAGYAPSEAMRMARANFAQG